MSELLIGESLTGLERGAHARDLYHGLSLLEKKHYQLVAFNLGELSLGAKDLERIFALLEKKQVCALFVSSSEKIKSKADESERMEFVPPDLKEELLADALLKLRKLNSLDKQLVNLSKQKRSLPFYLLGAALFAEPVLKVAYLKIQTGFDLGQVLGIVTSIESPMKVFEFWFLFPLAGLALVRTAWWSLFVFLGTHVYSLYAHFAYEKFSWPYVQDSPHVSSYLLLLLNTVLFLYFLFPENRKPFMRKTKEIFRGAKRIALNQQVILRVGDKNGEAMMSNISETGALIRTDEHFEIKDSLEVEVEIGGEMKVFEAVVVRELSPAGRRNDGSREYGIKFTFKKRAQRRLVQNFVLELDAG